MKETLEIKVSETFLVKGFPREKQNILTEVFFGCDFGFKTDKTVYFLVTSSPRGPTIISFINYLNEKLPA